MNIRVINISIFFKATKQPKMLWWLIIQWFVVGLLCRSKGVLVLGAGWDALHDHSVMIVPMISTKPYRPQRYTYLSHQIQIFRQKASVKSRICAPGHHSKLKGLLGRWYLRGDGISGETPVLFPGKNVSIHPVFSGVASFRMRSRSEQGMGVHNHMMSAYFRHAVSVEIFLAFQ